MPVLRLGLWGQGGTLNLLPFHWLLCWAVSGPGVGFSFPVVASNWVGW